MASDNLLDSALRTLNQTPSATMAEIAEGAGVSRATLNRRFASRDALLRELGERSIDRWESSLEDSGARAVTEAGTPPGTDHIRTVLVDLVHHYVNDAEIFGFTLTESRLEHFPDLVERTVAVEKQEQALFAAAQAAGLLRSDVTPQWISWSLFGLLVGVRDGLRVGDLARRGLEDTVTTTFLQGHSA